MNRKWTVILIPHKRGERHSFNLSDSHFFGVAGVVLGLCAVSVIFFYMNRAATERADFYEEKYDELSAIVSIPDWPKEYQEALSEREAAIRSEYAERDAALTKELKRLYKLEGEIRLISGLPPRDMPLVDTSPGDETGGQGGAPGDLEDALADDDPARFLPPEFVIDLVRPSADFMIEEMYLRNRSMSELLLAMEAQRERLAHTPSVWPTQSVKRRINSRYGRRRDPFTKQMRHHNGLDIYAPPGSPVRATADGVVKFSGWHAYLGHLVKLDHGYGLETWYGHMNERLVNEGDVVQRHDAIGQVGSTGRSTGPHIHYEVHRNEKRVDPNKYIRD